MLGSSLFSGIVSRITLSLDEVVSLRWSLPRVLASVVPVSLDRYDISLTWT